MRAHRFEQCLAIHLAIGGDRDGIDDMPFRRDHVAWQMCAKPRHQGRDIDILILCRLNTADDCPAVRRGGIKQGNGIFDAGCGLKLLFDFIQFDAETAQFDLIVMAAAKFDPAIAGPAGKVTGAIEPLARLIGIGDEPFAGQVGALPVFARQP